MADWVKEQGSPVERKWEEFYRNRFARQACRTTHGVNCTGSCSWEVFVKDGIVTWEMQATDYPLLEEGLPPYEPRGCQRGISFSWYLYSPLAAKYLYARRTARTLAHRAGRNMPTRSMRGRPSSTAPCAAAATSRRGKAASAASAGTRPWK